MDLSPELTHVWSKGPIHLAPVQGILALCSRVHRNEGPITEELAASFVGCLTQVYFLVCAQFTCGYDCHTG